MPRFLLISLVILVLEAGPSRPAQAILQSRPQAPEFTEDLVWLNRPSAETASRPAKLTVVYFWNVSQYESLNGLAFLNDLALTYEEAGLEVKAVHCGQYEFESLSETIQSVLTRYRLYVPVALDLRQEMRAKFMASSLPSVYLVDESHTLRKTLLPPFTQQDLRDQVLRVLAEYSEKLPRWPEEALAPSSEIFRFTEMPLGYQSPGYFGNDERFKTGEVQRFQPPEYFQPGRYYLGGLWRIESTHIETQGREASIQLLFQDRVLNAVLESGDNQTLWLSVETNDGPAPKELWGLDLKAKSGRTGVFFKEPRLYQILSRPEISGEPCRITLRFPEAHAHAYRLSTSSMPVQLKPLETLAEEETAGEDRLKIEARLEG